MKLHTPINEFDITIARYRRLAREVTDPLAACLLKVVIGDLEAAIEDDRRDPRGLSHLHFETTTEDDRRSSFVDGHGDV
jgi:hypothetical protein